MKYIAALLAVAAVSVFSLPAADEAPKDKPKAGALAPHPLDSAFEKGATAKAINEGLLNNALYKKAVAAALKAKADQEERFRKNPRLADASPAQAARKAFLDVLTNGK